MKILHIGSKNSIGHFTEEVKEKLKSFGEFTIVPNGENMPEPERAALIRETDVLLTIWSSPMIPEEVAQNPGKLKYVLHVTGEMRKYVPLSIIEAGILVSNWGPASNDGLAEGAMALFFAVLKNIRGYVDMMDNGTWGNPYRDTMSSIHGLNVGIYGMGAVGRRFVELIEPFKPILWAYDPYVESMPDICRRVGTLRELFEKSQAVIVHAGHSPETHHSVNAEMLSLLPDNGIIINTARGGLIHQEALFAELEKGRLRAGLDVLEPEDFLRPDDPARKYKNLLTTAHSVMVANWGTDHTLKNIMWGTAFDNLKRFINGEEILYPMTKERYMIST